MFWLCVWSKGMTMFCFGCVFGMKEWMCPVLVVCLEWRNECVLFLVVCLDGRNDCSVLIVCLEWRNECVLFWLCILEWRNECVLFWLCVWSELMIVFCFGCVFEVMEWMSSVFVLCFVFLKREKHFSATKHQEVCSTNIHKAYSNVVCPYT